MKRRIVVTLAVLLLLVASNPYPSDAAGPTTFKGSVLVEAQDIVPGGDIAKLPKVRVGVSQVEISLFDPVWGYTDENGDFELVKDYGDQSNIEFAIIVVLEDEEGLLEVTDQATGKPACMISKSFRMDAGGVINLDFLARIAISNDTQYRAMGVEFNPLQTACNGYEVQSVQFDPRTGVTNVGKDKFAHLAAMYAWAQDAAQFAKDGLDASPGRVAIVGYHSLIPTIGYLCELGEIWVSRSFSDYHSSIGEITPEVSRNNIRHEYGHHTHCKSSMSGSDSLADPPSADNHLGVLNDSSGDSLSEGFANFFAASVGEYLGESLPHLLLLQPGLVDLANGGERVDHPDIDGFNLTSEYFGEEFAVATLLWQLKSDIGLANLWGALESDTPSLENVKALRELMLADPAIAGIYGSFCQFATGAEAFGPDCLVVERGFYHDLNGDGLFSNGEVVGETRFPIELRPPEEFRPSTPAIPGSSLLITVLDQAGLPVEDATLEVELLYVPPHSFPGRQYALELRGSGPYAIPVHLSVTPSQLIVRAVKDGVGESDPLTIDSDFYHDAINPFRPGGVGDYLLEPTLVLGGEKAADLSVTKVDSADPVSAGDVLTYTITVSNAGPHTAENVRISDTLPGGVTLASTSGCAEDPIGVPWCTLGDLAPGGFAQYSIEVTVDAAATGVIVNEVTVVSDTSETDPTDNTASEDTTVATNRPPECLAASPNQRSLWPPNHQLIPVGILGVSDPDGDPLTITITSIFQDEPVNGTGDGSAYPDGVGVGTDTAHLRAERAQPGNGRVYHVSFSAQDDKGSTCAGALKVAVPRNQGKKGGALDEGPLFDSTATP